MKCIDDCHSYRLGAFMTKDDSIPLNFYRMAPDGTKVDGTTNEEVLRALIHRLNFLNKEWMGGKFACRENSLAITKLEEALMWLEKRTSDRVTREVEGTQEK